MYVVTDIEAERVLILIILEVLYELDKLADAVVEATSLNPYYTGSTL